MANVGLLYVGAVLFINALMLLDKIRPKSAAIFNIFVGGLQVLAPIILILRAKSEWDIVAASGIFLFGFTYLYVGITNILGYGSEGVGWYCLWVAILAVAYSVVNFLYFRDNKFGIIWLMWAALWALFFCLLALQQNIARFVGWVTLLESWVTCTIPAFLSLLGVWNSIRGPIVWVAVLVVIILTVLLYVFDKRSETGRRIRAIEA